MFIYSVDVVVPNEAGLLAKFAGDHRLQPTPDMSYHFVGRAPEKLLARPIVVGFGPAGIFAALVLAQAGFRPIVLERGKAVRERTQDTLSLIHIYPDSSRLPQAPPGEHGPTDGA